MPALAQKNHEVTIMDIKPKSIGCQNCDGIATLQASTYVTYNKNGKIIFIYNTPTLICNTCGEKYFNAWVAMRIEKLENTDLTEVDFNTKE